MLQYLPRFDAYLWVTTASLHVVTAWVVLRSRLHHAYAAFSVYTYFAAVLNVGLLILPAKLYFLGYTIGSITRSLLLAAVLFELYTRVCGPHFSLPAWAPRTMAAWLAVALGASFAVTCGLYTVRVLPKRAALLAAGQGGALMTLFLALVVLLAYSKYLGMEWTMRPRQIVIGLALYLPVNAVVLFLLNHVPEEAMRLLDRAGQFALLLSLVWWTFALAPRRREPGTEPATLEMIGYEVSRVDDWGTSARWKTLQQMLKDYHSTKGITDRIVLDKIIKNNCDITARSCKRIGDRQEEDSPLDFAAYNTRREAINLSRKCSRRGHTQDSTIPAEYDDFKDSVIHLFETTCLADAAGRIPELL